MKSLYIVRHAKSSWEFPELNDDERPLLPKGKKRTRKVISYLLEKQTRVDLIISSHAVRAYETAKLIAKAIDYPVDRIDVRSRLYHADTDDLLNQLFAVPDEIDSVMMVGHNPGFTRFASYFDSAAPDWLPTSGIVKINFNTSRWNEILAVEPEPAFIVYPKMLR